jgi:hypothetical protein
MGIISWAHGVSGDFNTAADWVGGVVPGGLDDAELTASGTYTVTSSQTNSVFGVALASGATLAVTNGTLHGRRWNRWRRQCRHHLDRQQHRVCSRRRVKLDNRA